MPDRRRDQRPPPTARQKAQHTARDRDTTAGIGKGAEHGRNLLTLPVCGTITRERELRILPGQQARRGQSAQRGADHVRRAHQPGQLRLGDMPRLARAQPTAARHGLVRGTPDADIEQA